MTTQEVALVPMKQSDLATLQAWFEDTELRKRLSGVMPLEKYFDYIQSEANYFAWMAMEGDIPVGAAFMQIESDEPQSFAFLVKPKLRCRGYGRSILQQLMLQPEVVPTKEWRVGIESDNLASQRCLASVGFVPESGVEDEEGFLHFMYNQSRLS